MNKRYLSITFFLFFCQLLFAQKSIEAYKKEHFQFKSGYYFDSTGSKTQGLIKHEYLPHNFSTHADNYIYYKPEKKENAIRLSPGEIAGFTQESDSFIVVKNFKFNSGLNYKEDLCKVVIKDQKVSLLEHYTLITKFNDHGPYISVDTGYVLVIKGMEKVHCVHKEYFKKDMMALFNINKELCERIQANEYKFEDTKQLVQDFNSWWKKMH